jgi:hypothetical protein
VEFLEDGGDVLGRFRVSRCYDPRVRRAVEADPWRADALIRRNADVLEARDVRVRQLLIGERALQQATPFGLMAGLGQLSTTRSRPMARFLVRHQS